VSSSANTCVKNGNSSSRDIQITKLLEYTEWQNSTEPCIPCRCWSRHRYRKHRRSQRCMASCTHEVPSAHGWSGCEQLAWSPGESATSAHHTFLL